MTMTLAWICAALIATTAPDAPPDPTPAYREALAKAGRSPDDQVRLALWCEAHGLTAERLHHLSLAVLADPRHAAARGLMGLVARDGRWLRPEVVAEKLKADADRSATQADYEARRRKVPYTADAQWALGNWAADHGLPEQARAHLTAVIRLDPSREQAWRKLGYKRHDGRWATDAQLAAEKAELDAQKAADRRWKPLFEKYKGMLEHASKRAEADAALAEVTDPRAVPSILRAFGSDRAVDQLRAVQLLGQVDSPSASRALAGLAVLANSAEVRRVALETLRRRDPRDFVRLWIALIRKPIRYEVRPVGGPGSPGELFVEGEKANLRRVYAPPPMPAIPDLPGASIALDANGLPVLIAERSFVVRGTRVINDRQFREMEENQRQPAWSPIANIPDNAVAAKLAAAFPRKPPTPFDNIVDYGRRNPDVAPQYTTLSNEDIKVQVPIGEMMLETQASAAVAQQQLAGDVSALQGANNEIRRTNDSVLMALKTITGGDLGDDRAAWNKWWTDQLGYATASATTAPVPTLVENVPIGYTPTATPIVAVTSTLIGFERVQHSCFAAGTTVRTIDGERPIESIRAGDLVLVQDTITGALGYQAVVRAFHNPPSATLKVKLDEADAVVATGIHRFWKAGKGWAMARDLAAGDLVRTLGGVARVDAVEPDRVQPVFNLEVAEGHSFLVGRVGALVHDNSLVEAVVNLFDAPAKPAK